MAAGVHPDRGGDQELAKTLNGYNMIMQNSHQKLIYDLWWVTLMFLADGPSLEQYIANQEDRVLRLPYFAVEDEYEDEHEDATIRREVSVCVAAIHLFVAVRVDSFPHKNDVLTIRLVQLAKYTIEISPCRWAISFNSTLKLQGMPASRQIYAG